jgi:hypothetical protein
MQPSERLIPVSGPESSQLAKMIACVSRKSQDGKDVVSKSMSHTSPRPPRSGRSQPEMADQDRRHLAGSCEQMTFSGLGEEWFLRFAKA